MDIVYVCSENKLRDGYKTRCPGPGAWQALSKVGGYGIHRSSVVDVDNTYVCRNKAPQTGSLKRDFLFLMVLEAVS